MQNNHNVKLWTRSFLLLWQGQLVSTLGDAAYAVALGFWVLRATGSTALMGTLEAASTLPGVLVSPFAGVIIDRTNKKLLLIAMDVLRGLCMVLIAIAAFSGRIEVWMVFAAGILLSVCGAFFRPGVSSSLPDLVPKTRLANANSLLASVTTGANMIGNAAGGFLFQALGAAVLFLFNGLSYFFSGSSLSFASIPRSKAVGKQEFFSDMRDGFKYMWSQTGLRYLILLAAFDNFVCFVAIVNFIPLFERTPSLGAGFYGVAMACFMGGAMAGYIVTSLINIPAPKRTFWFTVANLLTNICMIICVNLGFFAAMVPFIIIGGVGNAVVNMMLSVSVQAATAAEMRGKVMAFLSMVTQGLTPFAMALGGVLAGFIPIRLIITVCFSLALFILSAAGFSKPVRAYINYEIISDELSDGEMADDREDASAAEETPAE